MKKFFIKSAVFVAIVLVLNNLFNLGLVTFFKNKIYYPERSTWIKHLKEKPTIILMGSSTVKYGLSPNKIVQVGRIPKGTIVNVAEDAGTPMVNYYIYNFIENHIDSHSTVIYGLDPFVFSRRYYANDHLMPITWNPLERFYFTFFEAEKNSIYTALFGGNMNTAIRDIFSKWEHNSIPEDFGAMGIPVEELLNRPHRVLSEMIHYEIYKISDTYIARLANIKSRIEAKGGEFIFYLPPVPKVTYEDYRNKCNKYDAALIAQLNSHLGPVKVIGSLHFLSTETGEQYFSDEVHVNMKGQEIMSTYLAEQLMKIDSLNKKSLMPLSDY
jgi:hypothetical protein